MHRHGPCVRTPRSAGESTRRTLAELDVLDDAREIVVEDGSIFIPVTDAEAVPDRFETTVRELPVRETLESPADILGYEPSIERIGDVVVIDEGDSDRAREIADAVVESHVPVKTVLNRASKIKGTERVREWDVLYGEETDTVHREYGHEFRLDLAAVYFSPRLATERHRVVEQVRPDEHVFDMFAGVGPFAIPIASRGATVVATDVNDRAIEYLRENARRNDVADRVTAIVGDVREVADDWQDWADRIVMNLPHSAEEFLETAVTIAGETCVIHYYDIQHEDDPFGPGLAAIEAAAGDDYDVAVLNRREVRSYAPHEVNVCLDVSLRSR